MSMLTMWQHSFHRYDGGGCLHDRLFYNGCVAGCRLSQFSLLALPVCIVLLVAILFVIQ